MIQTQQITNIRHSANSANWISPPWITEIARTVMGSIDLDPASCARANEFVNAVLYFDKHINGLKTPWTHDTTKPSNIWINPPGGWEDVELPLVTKNKKNGVFTMSNKTQTTRESRVKLWWQRLLTQYKEDYFAQACWLSFSIETMQTTQIDCDLSVLDFPTCTFRSRVSYIDPDTGEIQTGMTHSSALTYIPGCVDNTQLFCQILNQYGKLTMPYTAIAA